DLKTKLNHLMLTVLPSKTGGFILLSYVDVHSDGPVQMIESLLSQACLTSAVVWLIACGLENVAISPPWWEALTEVERRYILRAFSESVNPFDSSHNLLRRNPLKVPGWGIGKPFCLG